MVEFLKRTFGARSSGQSLRFNLTISPQDAATGVVKTIEFKRKEFCACRAKNPSCDTCRGQGRYEKKIQLEIQIPAGIPRDSRIRVKGVGEQLDADGYRGDLYVFVYF